MKKLLLLLAAIGMVAMGCQTDNGGLDNGGNDGGITPPPTTETAKIASVEEQGAHITATLATLEDVKSALNTTIEALKQNTPATRGNDNGVKEQIENLEGQIGALEDIIIRLTAYMGGELVEMTDWASATFATLEQQEALATELAALKATVAGLDTVSSAELADALAASEASMNKWVNEQLSGYATVADMNAQIATLQASLTEDSEALREEIAVLTASLAESKKKITSSYKKAIKTAINDFAGVVDEQISNEIAEVNARLDEELATINSRLDDIEARLDKIEEAIKDLVNRIQSVVYVKKYGDNPTPIVTSAEATTVTLDFEVSPKSAIEGLLIKWEEYAKVKALYAETTTFVDMPITSFNADVENGIVTVVASGENLSAEFYTSLVGASLRLEISDGNNDKRSDYVNIAPQRWLCEGINIAPASNELYYVSYDGEIIVPCLDSSNFGSPIVSNLYDWQKGLFVLKCEGDVTKIGQYTLGVSNDNVAAAFVNLKYFAMPNTVTAIGKEAFKYSGLVSIVIPDSVTKIYDAALAQCVNLTSVEMGSGIQSWGEYIFSGCTSLATVNIPEKVTSIPYYAFNKCASLANIVIPNNITAVEGAAFANCSKLTTVSFSENLESLGNGAFDSCSKLKGDIVLPQTLRTLGKYTFHGCDAITSVTLSDNLTEVAESPFFNCSNLQYFYGKYASADNRCFVFNTVLKNVSPFVEGEYSIPDGVAMLDFFSISYPKKEVVYVLPESVTQLSDGGVMTGVNKIKGFKGKFASADGLSLVKDGTLYGFAPCGVNEYTIPEGVEKVSYRLFNRITSLETLTLPYSFKEVTGKFVDHCTNLKSVFIKAENPPTYTETQYEIFYDMDAPNIYVPISHVAKYKTADGWKDYEDKIDGTIF